MDIETTSGEVGKVMRRNYSSFLLGAVIVLSGCGPSEPVALPDGTMEQRIKFLSSDITQVVEVGDSLMVTHYKTTIANGHNWVWSFFEDAHKVMTRLSEASRGKQYRQVVFMVKLTARDNLGHEFEQQGMKVFYEMGKLQGANWSNMTTFDLMEIPSDIEFKRLGYELALDYCRDGENAKYSQSFCLRAIGKNAR